MSGYSHVDSIATPSVRAVAELDKFKGNPGAYIAFAQLILAKECKAEAEERMDDLNNRSAFLAEYESAVKTLKDLQRQAGSGTATMSKDMHSWLQKHGYPDVADRLSANQYQTIWKDIEKRGEEMSSGVNNLEQEQLVMIQDLLGQYQAFMQGSSTNISSMNQILAGLARA